MHRLVFVMAIAFQLTAGAAIAEESWLNQEVMPRLGWQPKMGHRKVDMGAEIPPYTVKYVQGNWLWIGRAWVKKSDVVKSDEAVAYYTDCIRKHPCSAQAHYLRAFSRYSIDETFDLKNSKDKDAVERDLDRAIKLAPRFAEAKTLRAVLELASEFDRVEDSGFVEIEESDAFSFLRQVDRKVLDKTLKSIEEVLREHPRCAFAYLARAESGSSGNYESMLADIDKILEIDPLAAFVWAGRADVLVKLGRKDEAITNYDRAISLDPWDNDAPKERAQLLIKCGRSQEAMADLDRLIKRAPSADLHEQRARVWLDLGNGDRAAVDLAEAIRLEPSFARRLLKVDNADADVKSVDDPLSALFKTQAARSLIDGGIQDWLFFGNHDNYDETIRNFRHALVLAPDFAPAHHAAGMLCLEKQRWEEADQRLTKAIERDPNYVDALSNRAVLRYATGKIDEARRDLEAAMRLEPSKSGTNNKDMLEAIEAWSKSLPESSPADPNRRVARLLAEFSRMAAGRRLKDEAYRSTASYWAHVRLMLVEKAAVRIGEKPPR